MPISDPGNAGTAPDSWPEPRPVEQSPATFRDLPPAERGARILALLGGTGAALAIIAALVWCFAVQSGWPALIVLAGWFALLVTAAGLVNFAYGPPARRKDRR